MDPGSFLERFQELKASLNPTELAELMGHIHEAHEHAGNVMSGNVPAKGPRIPEYTSVLGLLDNTLALDDRGLQYVDNQGCLYGGKYTQTDVNWVGCLLYAAEYKKNKGSFGGDAQTISLPDQSSLAIVGDWGTGYWLGNATPAKKVADQMLALHPDFTLHIGDTYYAGNEDEINSNLLNIFPKGNLGTFAIAGNHEMICGNQFFNKMLPQLCPLQKGVGYFALQNDNWLVISLDSSYYALGELYMDGTIVDENGSGPQAQWLVGLLKNAGSRKIILITHHQPVDLAGQTTNLLYSGVKAIFEACDKTIAVWYFGHEHNVAVYDTKAMPYPGRCIGHGAVPYGNAKDLNDRIGDTVIWAEQTNANDPDYPLRILNGFIELQFNGASLKETLYSENGDVRWSLQW